MAAEPLVESSDEIVAAKSDEIVAAATDEIVAAETDVALDEHQTGDVFDCQNVAALAMQKQEGDLARKDLQNALVAERVVPPCGYKTRFWNCVEP